MATASSNVTAVGTSAVTLLHGDCREIASTLDYTAVVSDPPYGMNWDTDHRRYTSASRRAVSPDKIRHNGITGDDKPFDPKTWIDRQKVVLFGSNHFSERLPTGTTLVWIKRRDAAFGSFLSDAELAWMKGGHGVYCFRHVFGNTARLNSSGFNHPTEKPVALMRWVLGKAGVTPDDIVLDPYCGSGSTLLACMDLGVPCIGIEIDAEHFATAQRRVAEHRVQSDLFSGVAV